MEGTDLHKRGTSAEGWEEAKRQRGQILDGRTGGLPPAFTRQNAAAPSGIRFEADRPPHQRAGAGR